MNFSGLDFEIRPGSGCGIFELGTSLWATLDLLRRMQNPFPQVDVKYDIDSSTTPVVVHIRPHIDLLFSEYHQRLHTIVLRRLRDVPPVTLQYKNNVILSPERTLKRVDVRRTFGPTYEGEDLRYPGVWFSFDEGSRQPTGQADDRQLEVKTITVCQYNGQELDAFDEVLECPVMCGDISSAVVKVHEGVKLDFYPSSLSLSMDVQLGITTAQDLIAELGPPPKTHYREDDRMTIHSRFKQSDDDDDDSSYFYNYFQHGIDFLISGSTHTVRKIVLHSNVPGSPLFHRYKRCPWEIQGIPEDDEDDSPPRKPFYESVEKISRFLHSGETPPSMILDRTEDEPGVSLPNSTTRLLGFDGIILEVSESGQVVSLILF